MDLVSQVNEDAYLCSYLENDEAHVRTPIMATPAAAGAGVVAAKAAGAVIGGGAVAGAAYAAYKAVVK